MECMYNIHIKIFEIHILPLFFFCSFNRGNKVVSILLSLVVISINIFFVMSQVNEANLGAGLLTLISIFAICYLLFNIYLVLHMCANMGSESIVNMRVSTKTF